MHIIEVFGRIFISALFLIEAVRKILDPDISMMYMSDHGVPEILFYPSIAFEIIIPLLLIAGYKTKIMASLLALFVLTVTIIFHTHQILADASQLTTFLKNISITPLIVLKSTVLPNSIESIGKEIPDLVLNPEFLRERSAKEDFINSKLIIFGGPQESTKKLADFYKKFTLCKTTDFKFTDLISASLVKYAINTFLATKVVFFNELNQIFNKSGAEDSWEDFIKMISIDKRVGSSHMQVPGFDGKFGYGGACFPKDSKALIKYSEQIGSPFNLLQKSNQVNDSIRRKYTSLSDREIDQNVNYESD